MLKFNTLKNLKSIKLTLLLLIILPLSACKPFDLNLNPFNFFKNTENQNEDTIEPFEASKIKSQFEVKQNISANPIEKILLNRSLENFRSKGFNCSPFNNGEEVPQFLCQLYKESQNCMNSVWLEHDGQNHIIQAETFNECEEVSLQ